MNLPTWKKTALRLEDVSENVVNDDSFKVIATANPNKINCSKTMIKQKVVEIEIEGKPSMILTMANGEIRDEQLRRFPMLFLNEGIDQTKEIIKRQAELAKTGNSIDYDDSLTMALSKLKRVPVKVPFADKLIESFDDSSVNVIARTAFNRFLDYIKSSAALFQYQRETDSEGYIIATAQDYENGKLCLEKTTSNLLMIPLSKLDKALYDFFKEHKTEELSIDTLMEHETIQHLAKSDRWIRYRCDFLVSKNFLKRSSKSVEGSFKPVCFFKYNEVADFKLPTAEELQITSNTTNSSNTTNTTINSNNSNTQDKGVNEVFEVNETILTKHTFKDYCGNEFKDEGQTFICGQLWKSGQKKRCFDCKLKDKEEPKFL